MVNPLAFPSSKHDDGMRLRDYFAGQILASVDLNGLYSNGDFHGLHIAKMIYALADAMLEERLNRY